MPHAAARVHCVKALAFCCDSEQERPPLSALHRDAMKLLTAAEQAGDFEDASRGEEVRTNADFDSLRSLEEFADFLARVPITSNSPARAPVIYQTSPSDSADRTETSCQISVHSLGRKRCFKNVFAEYQLGRHDRSSRRVILFRCQTVARHQQEDRRAGYCGMIAWQVACQLMAPCTNGSGAPLRSTEWAGSGRFRWQQIFTLGYKPSAIAFRDSIRDILSPDGANSSDPIHRCELIFHEQLLAPSVRAAQRPPSLRGQPSPARNLDDHHFALSAGGL